MRKSILITAIVLFGALFSSCRNTTREAAAQAEVDSLKTELDSARSERNEAHKAATAEQLQAFREESNIVIQRNEARIAALRAEGQKTGNKLDAAYQKKIDVLEQKNKELAAKLESFKNDTSKDWEEFKREFKHDTDDLRKSLVNFTQDNK